MISTKTRRGGKKSESKPNAKHLGNKLDVSKVKRKLHKDTKREECKGKELA